MITTQVTIIGAGPTGLLLGCFLLKQGIDCVIVERNYSTSQETKALMIHARSLEILEELNVITPLLTSGIVKDKLCFYVRDGETFIFSFKNLNSKFACYLIVPQPEVEKVLKENFLSLGGKIMHETKYLSCEQNLRSIITKIESPNGLNQIQSNYLVGCDGASSSVRQSIGIDFDGTTYNMDYVLAEGTLEKNLIDNAACMYISNNGVLSVLPISTNKYRVAGPGIGKRLLNENEKMSITIFNEMLENISLFDTLKMKDFDRITNYRVSERLAANFYKGRAFLAGDAAHIHSPAGGQAMNVGFQDAYNLAEKISSVVHKKSPENLLKQYQNERYPIAEEAIKTANFFELLNKMRQATTPADIDDIHQHGIVLVHKLSGLKPLIK
jgi:2-polyprenyl-6-methoxyphenol hydroxylase-like FAD-dependent oxidoreductase